MAAHGIISKIPSKDDNKLLKLFLNAQREKLKGNKNAPPVIDAIQDEWRRRLEMAQVGNYKATMPDKGMLATFGYHVGVEGEPKDVRKKLLETIFVSDLPLVGSPAYTLQWGNKKSQKRYIKMRSTLIGLVNSNRKYGSRLEQAIEDWLSDLEYVDSDIRNLIEEEALVASNI